MFKNKDYNLPVVSFGEISQFRLGWVFNLKSVKLCRIATCENFNFVSLNELMIQVCLKQRIKISMFFI